MKTLVYAFALIMLALSSCETVEIEKLIYDTVYLEKPQQSLAPSFITIRDTVVIRDTVEVRIVIHDTVIQQVHTTDTVFQVVTKDSLIIKETEKIVHHYDTTVIVERDTIIKEVLVTVTDTVTQIVHDTTTLTVYDRTVVYLDTAYVFIYMRNITSIPEAIQPHVNEFFGLTSAYNKNAPGGPILIYYVPGDDIPGEQWVSHSYWIGGAFTPYGQMVIEISESLPPELHRASILRELGRLQLKRKYVTDVNKIMCPLFPPSQQITQTNLNDLFSLPI